MKGELTGVSVGRFYADKSQKCWIFGIEGSEIFRISKKISKKDVITILSVLEGALRASLKYVGAV